MRKTVLTSFLAGTCSFVLLSGSPLLAQAAPPSQQQQQPARPELNPNANNPNANNPDTMTSHVDDKKFVNDAAEGGMMEVELGKIAAEKGGSEGVKQFGQKMVDDHSKANDQLKEVASKNNMQLPTSLSGKQQAMVDKLSKLSGTAFDKAYMKGMVKDHEMDVHDFETEAQNGNNPDVKQFAATTLPTLKEHLQMAKDLHKKEKSKS